MTDAFEQERLAMVERQLIPRGIKDRAVIRAMQTVPRHLFVPSSVKEFAYKDAPLPIGEGQTISQPYIVALMTQVALLTENSIVLDIGTGSGYAAALLSRIVKQVYSIERLDLLANKAKKRFKTLGYDNISVSIGDGTLGLKEHAPFDAIIVTAGAPNIPHELCEQLSCGGRLIIPIGGSAHQELLCIRYAESGELLKEQIEHVRFVPLIGKEGW